MHTHDHPVFKCLGRVPHRTAKGEVWEIEHWRTQTAATSVDWFAARIDAYYLSGQPGPPWSLQKATAFQSAHDAAVAVESFAGWPTPVVDQAEIMGDAQPGSDEPPRGLRIERFFSKAGTSPFDDTAWRTVDCRINDAQGNPVWSQDGVEVPEGWSDQAAQIVASKYFYGDPAKGDDPCEGGRESSVRQLVYRVCNTIAAWGYDDGYFETAEDAVRFHDELAALCLGQHAAFNSPVWFNVGLADLYGLTGAANGWVWDRLDAIPCGDALLYPQASACFIQSVQDDMGSICDLATSEMMLFKYGSGTGTDLSTLRSSREKLAGGGKPSGPVSFMRVYDAGAGVVKSGGKTRRAAKMQTLRCDHPDVLEFVGCKAKEEKKARALIAAGYSAGMSGDPDEAYSSVFFQNSNLSVRATDEFMVKASTADSCRSQECYYPLRAVVTGDVLEEIRACDVLDDVAHATWLCGDPGLQFHDTIQRWHTCPNTAPINSSNPCSEFVFIDDSACNLASINLMKFRRQDGTFDDVGFRAAVRLLIIAQDILVDRSSYPTKRIAQNSHRFRPLGLGYANLGALIMANGLPYDSDQARQLAAAITSIMGGQAYLTSAGIAEQRGPFAGHEVNAEPMRWVIDQHYQAARRLFFETAPETDAARLSEVGAETWLAAAGHGHQHGFRNSQTTVLAPTGTIAFMMDCDTTGVEPETALVKYKTLAGSGMMKIVNRTVPLALRSLYYESYRTAEILNILEEEGSIEPAISAMIPALIPPQPFLRPDDVSVFDCAFPSRPGGRSIDPMGHIRMMAAVQPFLSGAISKTCNVPADATVQQIRDLYVEAWRLGLKAVAIYRDGSKGQQPLKTQADEPARDAAGDVPVDDVSWDPLVSRLQETNLSGLIESVSESTITAPPWRVGDHDVAGESLVYREGGDCPIGTLQELANLANLAGQPSAPQRDRLPDTRRSTTHKFSVGGHEGYATVGFFPDGRPGELFVRMAKEGSTIGGLMDQLATAISIGLQHGVPLEVFVNKLAYTSFEPAGMTRNPDVPFARSLTDYLGRWLGCEFIAGFRAEHSPRRDVHKYEVAVEIGKFPIASEKANGEPESLPETYRRWVVDEPAQVPGMQIIGCFGDRGFVVDAATARQFTKVEFTQVGPACDRCGHVMVRTGACHTCPNCGNAGGCG